MAGDLEAGVTYLEQLIAWHNGAGRPEPWTIPRSPGLPPTSADLLAFMPPALGGPPWTTAELEHGKEALGDNRRELLGNYLERLRGRLTAAQRRRLVEAADAPEGVRWSTAAGSHCALEQLGLVEPVARADSPYHDAVPTELGRALRRHMRTR